MRGLILLVYRLLCPIGDAMVEWARHFVDVKPQWVNAGPDILDHVIVVDNEGRPAPVYPTERITWLKRSWTARYVQSREQVPDEVYQKHLRRITGRINQEGKNVAIIVHGGLGRVGKSLRKSIAVLRRIHERGDAIYPIFIIWDSWISAIPENLLLVRSGRYERWGPISAPLYVLGDLLASLSRLFQTFAPQVASLVFGSSWYPDRATEIAGEVAGAPGGVDVRPPTYTPRKWSIVSPLLFLVWLALTPVRTAFAALLVPFAPRTWQCLQRRAHAMFRAPREFDPLAARPGHVPTGKTFEPATGAVAQLAERLAADIGRGAAKPIKVTLIPHSMGSMITNELIEYAGDRLRYDAFVYMAPACTVSEFADAVVPALRRNPDAQAWVLTLHPKVETNEATLWGVLPRGSILEWLEGFLDPPKAHLDRMLGKYDNVMRALHIFPPDVRERVHIKAFSFDANHPAKPCKHTQFNEPDLDPPFWDKAFWT